VTATSDTRTRFQRRQWQRRVSSLRPILIAVGLLGLISFIGWVVFFSSWLAATDIEVSGEETVSQQRILETAHVDLGTPLVRLDLDEIQQRIAALPAVAEVSVHRSWPHTVSIGITEREPIAAVHRGDAWWVMDHEGVVFRPSPDRDPSLPVVELRPQAFGDTLPEVAGVVGQLPSDLMSQVEQITARSMDSIRLELSGKRTVVWGSAADSDRKAAVLDVLLGQVKASVYDVSVPDQPTTSR
jgi:cell division protein FtsQ